MSCTETAKAVQDLNETVRGMLPDAESRVAALEENFEIEKARLYDIKPIFRLSRNQLGVLDSNNLPEYFAVNGSFQVTFSEVFKTSPTGTPFSERPAEERELLNAMGRGDLVNSIPSQFSVLRVMWSGAPYLTGTSWLFFQQILMGQASSHGSYAKLVSGGVSGGYFTGITSEWSVCGYVSADLKLGYLHPHPYATTPNGEVLFCLPGSVAGRIPFNKQAPVWSYYQRIPLTLSNSME